MDDSSTKGVGKDKLIFVEKLKKTDTPKKRTSPWKIVIVDDEKGVHDITRLALDNYTFEGRGLSFLSAYSGKEAKELIQQHPDGAVVLLDVVMETDDVGLDVARFIREELNNHFIRIVLRTGQPGKAPAKEIITAYDINDYKEKARLNNQELFTTITASLRAFRDLKTIEKNRKGLEQLIKSSGYILQHQTFRHLASGALTQLLSILQIHDECMQPVAPSGFAAYLSNDNFLIHEAMGTFEKYKDATTYHGLPTEIQNRINKVLEEKRSLFIDNVFIGYFCTKRGIINLLYLDGCGHLSESEKDLIRIFTVNLSIAFDNIDLYKENIDTQKEVILVLGDTIETRSDATANHVRRVAEMSHLLALKAGLTQNEAELLRFASPMHDVGKVGITDSILLKPGKLTPDEFEVIKHHAAKGYNLLKGSDREIMKTAAIVAYQHHERWDGTGYPQGLKDEEISIFGRITTLIDVFDALSHKRCYKEAWEMDRVIEYITKHRGRIFDPNLVDIFLADKDEFIALNDLYPDE